MRNHVVAATLEIKLLGSIYGFLPQCSQMVTSVMLKKRSQIDHSTGLERIAFSISPISISFQSGAGQGLRFEAWREWSPSQFSSSCHRFNQLSHESFQPLLELFKELLRLNRIPGDHGRILISHCHQIRSQLS